MPHFEELYPSRFLKGVTLAKPKTIRIVSFAPEALENDDGKKVPKAILKYKDRDGDGEMVCCKTNAALIAAMYGPDFSTWPGKLVTLHFDQSVRFGSEKPGGIRVLGSPDLPKPLEVTIKRPRRKKPEIYLLQPTGAKAPQQQNGNSAPSQIDADTMQRWQAAIAECTDARDLEEVGAQLSKAVPVGTPGRDPLDQAFVAKSKELAEAGR
jgi:hypothetical protein